MNQLDNNQFLTFSTAINPELKDDKVVPLISIRGMAIFPGMVFHFDLGREKSLLALDAAMNADQQIFLVEQKNEDVENPGPNDLYRVGCIAEVKQRLNLRGAQTRVMVEVKQRATIDKFITTDPFFVVAAKDLEVEATETEEDEALLRLIDASFKDYLALSSTSVSDTIVQTLEFIEDPNVLIDIISANMDLEIDRAQILLEEKDTHKRLMALYQILVEETEFLEIEQAIDEKVRNELNRSQREFVLREQIRVIQDELGEDDEDHIQSYYKRLDSVDPPIEVREKVETEINRLRKMPSGSSESGVIESYLDWILDLPWSSQDELNHDVKHARKILNEDHYALENVKERILEYISVLQLSDNLKSPILCLVGAPGVGKTSIAKSIARATGRHYTRLSLGGMRDEAEIRGHRRTYLGSIPGRIIYQLKMAKVNNPLFLLDEIDKMNQDFKGDPASALLEVLDPEQNSSFTDNYLELPFDLSNVLFITTANSTANIPAPLLDRMEVIEVNGYVESEKIEIATRYLIPELLSDHGIKPEMFKISRNAISDIINFYTRESGVRELKRKLARVCRIAAKEIVEDGKRRINVTQKNLVHYLGQRRYRYDQMDDDEKEIGLVTGLAVTSVGGETLQIEVVTSPGKGNIQITGQLGKVMQESVQAALSFIRSHSKKFGLEDTFKDKIDIHVHVPEGAVPKDGPSAGITIATALLSALTKQPVRTNIAMTGEITLRGRVLPVGGLREKFAAAHRAGIKTIFYPAENKRDLDEIPTDITHSLELIPVNNMSEVAERIFTNHERG